MYLPSFGTDLRCGMNFDHGLGMLSLDAIDRAEIATNQMIDDTSADAIAQDIHRRSNSIPEHVNDDAISTTTARNLQGPIDGEDDGDFLGGNVHSGHDQKHCHEACRWNRGRANRGDRCR